MVVEIAFALTAFFAAPAAVGSASLPETFVAACLDGKASLPPGATRAVGIDRLPSNLRTRLGNPTSGHVWQLPTSDHSYLYVLHYDDSRSENARVCGLASDSMNGKQTADAVEKRMTGYVGSERLDGMQWLMPKDGYIAVVTKADGFTVAQISWLTERGRAALLREVRSVTP